MNFPFFVPFFIIIYFKMVKFNRQTFSDFTAAGTGQISVAVVHLQPNSGPCTFQTV